MTTNKNVLIMGILLLISGMIAGVSSFEPSAILQYSFVPITLAVGILAVLVGRSRKGGFVRSAYYSWIGFVLMGLSIALVIWSTGLTSFINVVGFFVLILGIIEFVFAMQILGYETPIPWKLFGVKITLSALTATGAAWMLTMAGSNIYIALLFLGILFVLAGLNFIHVSRLEKAANGSAMQ